MSNSENTAFDKWNIIKKEIHISKKYPRCKKREIRWAYLGKNIGTEVYGKGIFFMRPVLVLETFFCGKGAFVIPLSSKEKRGKLYEEFYAINERKQTALLYQSQYIDSKRMGKILSSVNQKTYSLLKKRVGDVFKIYPSL